MKRSLLVAVVAGACVVGPAVAQAAPRSGVVVDYRAHSHTATVATKSGKLIAVHTRKAVRVGTRVNVNSLRRLSNGTLAATLARTGRARHARIRGVIVAKPGRHAIAIGTKGATFVVKTGHSRVHHAFSNPLTVGMTVMADVSINGDELDADDVTAIQGAKSGQMLELEGTVSKVDTMLRTLTITVSDDGVSADFTVKVPDTTIDLTTFKLQSEVELNVTANGDGTFTLQSGDENGDEQEADDDDGGDDSGHGGGRGGKDESAVHA